MIAADSVQAALHAWPHRVDSIKPLPGGWNSITWLVDTAQGRFVAKLVDDLDGPGLIRGLKIADFLAERGMPCGAPVRTSAGELTISRPEGVLALLRHESGTAPDPSMPSEVRRAGRALARAHEALRDYPVGSDSHFRWPWEWVEKLLDTVAMPEHVNAAARRVWPEIVRLVADRQVTISVIHADPGLSSFLLTDHTEESSQDGIIDWVTTLRGPLLYDLACVVVMTKLAGHPQVARWFIDGYVAQSPWIRTELDHLDGLVKARWLANAIYFADRIQRGIDRGSDSPTANQDGLTEAYAGMTGGS